MTPQQLVGIAVRVIAIIFAITALSYINGIAGELTKLEFDRAARDSIVAGVLFMLVAILLWLFPMAIAHKLIPRTNFKNQFNTRPDEVAAVVIAILGLWKLSELLPDSMYYFIMASIRSGSNSVFQNLNAEAKAYLLANLIEISIAIFMLLKAKVIATFISEPFTKNDVENL